MELGNCIQETGTLHIHQQSKVVEEVSSYDGVPNICNDENPSKGPAESQVEGERLSAKGCDGGPVHCLQVKIVSSTWTCGVRAWDDTHFRSGVHQVACARGTIADKEEAT